MRKLLLVTLGVAGSLILYVAVFSVVHRPLTLGDIARYLDVKLGYARTLPSPKLILFAGSNGRYSHRCGPMAAPLGVPCANLSIGVGIGLDFLLDQVRSIMQAGDIVYMPLEYEQYSVSEAEMNAGMHNATLVHDRREQLWQLPAYRIVQAYAYFDLPFLIHGAVEMALDARGHARRTSLATLTPQGDESGHTAAAAQAYAGFLGAARLTLPNIPADSHAQRVLRRFLVEAREHGVVVVGGLPTVPDHVHISPGDIERIRAAFVGGGQRMLVLDNRSQYALDCFFDTLAHLNEDCQRRHSAQVGKELASLLRPEMASALDRLAVRSR